MCVDLMKDANLANKCLLKLLSLVEAIGECIFLHLNYENVKMLQLTATRN